MTDGDEHEDAQSLSRPGCVVLGSVLLLGGLVAGLLTVVPLLWRFAPDVMSPDIPTAPRPLDLTAHIILALFGPMALVLLIASWNAFARAVTGQVRDLLNRGTLRIFTWVLLVLFASVWLSLVIDGRLLDAVGFFATSATVLVWFFMYLRQEPRGSAGPPAVERRPRGRSRSQ